MPTALHYPPHRLRVHLPQHFITTFCSCGEFSYHRDYILRHQRTMNCYQSHLYDVDEASYPRFFRLIRPLVSDPVRLERLSLGFPAPRPITPGPVIKLPGYKPPPSASHQSSKTPSLFRSFPRVILQRVETNPRKRSLSPARSTDRKRRWLSSSPHRSTIAKNLREAELRARDLEKKIQRLTPRIAVATSKLQALHESIVQLRREDKEYSK